MRFGLFELDLVAGELCKNGRKIKLQEQPFRLLCVLLEHPGQAVGREQLTRVLWPADTFVDFDHSLNAAIAKVRQVLGDSAENPRFIETLARRGYRFIAPVTFAGTLESNATLETETAVPTPSLSASKPLNPETAPQMPNRNWLLLAIAAISITALSLIGLVRWGPWVGKNKRIGETLVQLTSSTGLTMDPAVSPDGRLLAYVSDRSDDSHLNLWVQQLTPGGSAVQLTHSNFDVVEPSFSPDGNLIAFHSGDGAGGVYTIPSIGGQSSFVAPSGRNPRFSRDGNWIAYWTGVPHKTVVTGGEGGEVFVVRANGGTPRRVATDLPRVGNPIWSPDSKRLMLSSLADDDSFHWVVSSLSGEASYRVNIFDSLKQQGFFIGQNQTPRVTQWSSGAIVFSAWHGDVFNVWRMPVSTDGQSMSAAERLTSGTTLETSGQLIHSGALIFASLSLVQSIWSLPMDTNHAVMTGALRRITSGALEAEPSISQNGQKVAYVVSENAHSPSELGGPESPRLEVRIKDLQQGRDYEIPDGKHQQSHPVLSRDGNLLSFSSSSGIEIYDIRQVPGHRVGHFRGAKVWGWSPDNNTLLIGRYPDPNLYTHDVVSGRDSVFIPGDGLYQARYSPDNRAVALVDCSSGGGCCIRIVPLTAGHVLTKADWITIDNSGAWDDKPRWSPDGGLVYFVSNRDGRFCLWGQRVERISKRPSGAPFAIRHFHTPRLLMDNVGTSFLEIDVARDKVVVGLGELSGNLWESVH